jgi:hypothetical protein
MARPGIIMTNIPVDPIMGGKETLKKDIMI